MASELLLDTGALVSLLDRSQNLHRQFWEFFGSWRGQVVRPEFKLESTGRGTSTGFEVRYYLSTGAIQVRASENYDWLVKEVDFVSDGPAPAWA